MLLKPTIAITPEADPARDQAQLFAHGLDHVRRLSRRSWTDHNLHDPGITTLELLAYALTDLAYRASFPLEDLLATATGNEETMAGQFAGARCILPGRPVTTDDYRKLLIDLPDIRNAWLQPEPLRYYADLAQGSLSATPTGVPGEQPVDVRGLFSVLVEYMDTVTTAAERAAVDRRVLATLNANRALGDDFVGVSAVETQLFSLCAEIDLAGDAEADTVAAQIAFQVDRFLAPPVANYRLAEMLERNHPDGTPYTAPEIFEGPLLANGFIDDAELAAAGLRSEVRLSDVISVIMDIPGVLAIRDIVVNVLDAAGKAVEPADKWRLPVPAGHQPRLSSVHGRLLFYKRNVPIPASPARVAERLAALREGERRKLETPIADDLPMPLGRWRDTAAYQSFQLDFPALYGLSESGLPPGATPLRAALALQFKAYLLFFDQIMANYLAQLAQVRDLFSRRPELGRTYFSQLVDKCPNKQKIYDETFNACELAKIVEVPGEGWMRRNRFLDHLLARYAEEFNDYVQVMQSRFGLSPEQAAAAKCAFLEDYPRLGGERGLAYDSSRQDAAGLWNSDNVSGFERRIARLLDIGDIRRRNLSDIPYDMYAEIDATPGDEFRFRILHPDGEHVLLSSSTHYVTREDARREMEQAIRLAQQPEAYDRREARDGRLYFNIVDPEGEVIARRIEYFTDAAAMEAAIAELIAYLRNNFSGEGLYLIEHILLRPDQSGDPFMPICQDSACAGCSDADPYSYRVSVVLPAYVGRFADMAFRRFVEETLRQEMPAHLLPRICWVNSDDMAAIELAYREWLAVRSGSATPGRAAKLGALIEALTRAKNIYPSSGLHECSAVAEPFLLGRTALGSAGRQP